MELSRSSNFTTENSTDAPSTEVFEGEARILVAAIVEVTICIVGSIGNLLTCLAVMRNSSLQFATNFFIVSLAVADLLVCTILVPMRAAQHFSFFLGKKDIHPLAVQIAGFLGRVNIVASICSLASLSIDRCIAIKYPMRYRFDIRYATRRVLAVIFAFWVFAIVFTSLPYVPGITDDVFLIGFIVFVLFVTAIIMLAYFRIFHVATKSRKRRKVGAIDIDLEETKSKSRKKSLHVHFSKSSRAHGVSRKSHINLKTTNPQCSKSLLRVSAVCRFSGIPRAIAQPGCSTKVMDEQTLTRASSSQHQKGQSRVSVVSSIKKTNLTSTIQTHNNENGIEHTGENGKTPLQPQRDVNYPCSLPASNCTASHDNIAQSVFTITSNKEIAETSPTTTQNGDMQPKNRQSFENLNFPNCDRSEDFPRAKQPVQCGSASTAQATQVLLPYKFGQNIENEQTIIHNTATTHGINSSLQDKLQRPLESPSNCELIHDQITYSKKSNVHNCKDPKTRLNNSSMTNLGKQFNAKITNSRQEANGKLHGDFPKLQSNCAVNDLNKQLNAHISTNTKEDSVQGDPQMIQNLSSSNDSEEQKRIKKDRHKDHKTTKTIGIVIGAFIALVYPRIIMILYHYGNKPFPASLLAKFWVRILLYTNSAVNPLLYAWRLRDFRNEFSKIIFSLFRCGKIQRKVRIHPSQCGTVQSSTGLSTDVATAH